MQYLYSFSPNDEMVVVYKSENWIGLGWNLSHVLYGWLTATQEMLSVRGIGKTVFMKIGK